MVRKMNNLPEKETKIQEYKNIRNGLQEYKGQSFEAVALVFQKNPESEKSSVEKKKE